MLTSQATAQTAPSAQPDANLSPETAPKKAPETTPDTLDIPGDLQAPDPGPSGTTSFMKRQSLVLPKMTPHPIIQN